MKTSTTKKMLVTIALTSAGISVDFAFAGPRPPRSNSEPISKLVYDISDTTNTSSELKTEKCLSDYYLNVAVKYFPPEVRKKVMLVNKKYKKAILNTELEKISEYFEPKSKHLCRVYGDSIEIGFDKGTRTFTVCGKDYSPKTIESSFINNLRGITDITPENKINLKLENCRVERESFSLNKNFINNLTVGKNVNFAGVCTSPLIRNIKNIEFCNDTKFTHAFPGISAKNVKFNKNITVTVIGFSGSFNHAKITENLVIEDNVEFQVDIMNPMFEGAKINNLIIGKTSIMDENFFGQAQIENLTINKDAQIGPKSFQGARVTSAKWSDGTLIPDEILREFGFAIDKIEFDEGTRTFTVCGNDYSPKTIESSFINNLRGITDITPENKINLKLENCIVESELFSLNENFINNLTVGKNVGFRGVGTSHFINLNKNFINNLIVRKNVDFLGVRTSPLIRNITNIEFCNDTELLHAFPGISAKNVKFNKNITVTVMGLFGSFNDAKITENLVIDDNVKFQVVHIMNPMFKGAKINNLIIGKTSIMDENFFGQAQIENLTINKDAQIGPKSFQGARVTSAKWSDGTLIPDEKLRKFGFLTD